VCAIKANDFQEKVYIRSGSCEIMNPLGIYTFCLCNIFHTLGYTDTYSLHWLYTLISQSVFMYFAFSLVALLRYF
jgi:hypothetical protein